MLGFEKLSQLIEEVKNQIEIDITVANRSGTLDDYLRKIGFLKEEYLYCEPHTSKVLVMGQTSVGKSELVKVIKDLGLDPNRFEFILDYNDCKRYPMYTLRGNTKYSDLLLGPMPHKTNGMGDCSSIIAEIRNNQTDYPKAQVMMANGEIKITKASFREALLKTQYMAFTCSA